MDLLIDASYRGHSAHGDRYRRIAAIAQSRRARTTVQLYGRSDHGQRPWSTIIALAENYYVVEQISV